MLFIGPTLLAGIGQMLIKYKDIFPNSEYYTIDSSIPGDDQAIVFALPIPIYLQRIPELKKSIKKLYCMTICETETVHESYGDLFAMFDTILVSSVFCRDVFSRQFPDKTFKILRAYVPPPKSIRVKTTFGIPTEKYIFYHIGNVLDQRKNTNKIIEAFIRLELPNSFLVLKATCLQDVKMNIPNVLVINGLIDQSKLDGLHALCDCYVSFSSSEGIGMGAVEAALHNKPVIITDYGGAVEYIKTPYTIYCGLQEIPCDDFLFKKGMLWGSPNFQELMIFMKDAYDKKLTYMDHEHTRKITSKSEIYTSWSLM